MKPRKRWYHVKMHPELDCPICKHRVRAAGNWCLTCRVHVCDCGELAEQKRFNSGFACAACHEIENRLYDHCAVWDEVGGHPSTSPLTPVVGRLAVAL